MDADVTIGSEYSAELAALRERIGELEASDARRRQAEEALRAQARQQAAVAELGQRALAGAPLDDLLRDAAELVAQTLVVELSAVLEARADGASLLLRAGVGWRAGVVGQALVGAGNASQAGYTLAANEPIVVEDLRTETRFTPNALLLEHGVVSSLCAVIHGRARPFGVLSVSTRAPRRFRDDHIQFLRACANVLAAAIERARADDELAESEQRFRALVEVAPDIIFSASTTDGTLTALNPAFEAITGWPRAEWLGQPLTPLVHPDDLPLVSDKFARLARGEHLPPFEMRVQARTGAEVALEVRAAPRLEDGRVVEAFGIARDMTLRHVVDAELRRSRDELAIILHGVGDAITVQDPASQIVYANAAAARMLGYASVEELLAAPVAETLSKFELLAEDGGPFPIDELPGRKALRGEPGGEALVRFRVRATQAERWSIVKAMPVLTAAGAVQFAVNIFHDVTEQRLLEARERFLAEASATLANSLDYETTLETIAALAVPRLADWCVLNVQEDGVIQRSAYAHVDPDKALLLRLLQERYPPDPALPRGVASVLRTGQPQLTPEVSPELIVASARDAEHLDVLRALNPRSIMVVPLIARGHILGALSFCASESGRRFGTHDLALAEELARRAALAMDNALLYRDATRNADRLAALARASEAFASARLDLRVVLDELARHVVDAVGDGCVIRLLSDDGRWLEPLAVAHVDVQAEAEMRAQLNMARHGADEGQQGRVAQTGDALLFPRLALGDANEPLNLAYRDWFEQHAVHSLVIVPLRLRGAVIGTLAATRDRTSRPYTHDDQTLLQDLADRAALAVDSARRYREARDAVQQLDESVALLDTLIGAAPVGFGVWDTDLRYLRINDTLAAINGSPAPAHLGRTLREMLPELADRLEPLLRQVIATGAPVLDLEVSGQTPAAPGQPRHWLASFYPVQAPGGPILGLGGVVVEITERKRIEQAAAELLDRERVARAAAQQATRQREEFLSIASHELKTPLTSIKASAQLFNRWLRRPDIDLPRLETLSEQMRAEIERLELLVTDLLDASRIQQGRLELRPATIDLAQLAADALARFEHAPERTHLHTLTLDAPAPVVGQWDPARLEQVLINLLSNALKYSPAGGAVRVRVRSAASQDAALLTVSDSGIGIAPEEQAQLFQPFARGATARQSIGGTGLGLYISAQIVEQHGGQITVQSALGVGSAFTVRLPLAPRRRRG